LIGCVLACAAGFQSGGSAAAASPATGGVTLDGYGGLHAFGTVNLNSAGAASWGSWDIARALTVRPDGSGGWTLDGFGGIHQFGTAAAVRSPAFWNGWDIARAFVMTSTDAGGLPDGRQGYLLDGWGGVHAWGGAPPLAGAPYTQGRDIWRGLAIHLSAAGVPDGGWMLDVRGHVTAFGAAPPLPLSALPDAPVFQQLHGSASAGYVVARYGVVTTYGGASPYWSGYSDWGSADIIRDIALVNATNPTPSAQPVSSGARAAYQSWTNPHGGVRLDGWGGLHPFGGMPLDTRGGPYWGNWDIARSLAVRADGTGGWILDGFGGIHGFGAEPGISTPAYWSSWDIARAMVVVSRDSNGQLDGRQGYLLDGWGGVHAWGGAPALSGMPYTPYQDKWRGLEIHYSAAGTPDGGWVMDRWGNVSAFGAAPAITIGGLPGAPVMQNLHAIGSGGYAVTKWGVVRAYGSGVAPYWSGYSDWGAWDIGRDLVLVDATNPSGGSQPVSSEASVRLNGAATLNYTMVDPLIAQTHNLDCESAALRMALLAKGVDRSENWILAQMGADLRKAVVDQYGDVLQWGDPYQTFVGNVNGLDYNATGYGVYYPPIAMSSARAGRNALGQEGWNPHDLYVEVAAGNPVVIWVPVYGYWSSATMRTWTAWDGRAIRYTLVEHAMTLIGVNAAAGTVTINDPNRGFVRTVSMASFEAAFAKFNNMAVVVY
jgi:uncharacterized protein YvpB